MYYDRNNVRAQRFASKIINIPTLIFTILWLIITGLLALISWGTHSDESFIAKDVSTMRTAHNAQEFITYLQNGQSCFGVFTLKSDTPVNNSQYGVPSSLQYCVTKQVKHNEHFTQGANVAYDKCDIVYLDNMSIQSDRLFNHVYKNNAKVVNNIQDDIEVEYIPNKIKVMIGYCSKKKLFLIFTDTNTPIQNQFTKPEVDSSLILITIFHIAGYIILLMIINNLRRGVF